MARPLRAQGLPTALRDSAVALLADSLLDESVNGFSPSRHQLRVRTVRRQYTVAGTTINESAGPLSYQYADDRWALLVNGTPLSFSAPTGSLRGATPVRGRVAVRIGARDTLQLTGQSASAPGTLSTQGTAALGSIATSTIDLDAIAIGLPSAIGLRAVHVQPLDRVLLAIDAGLEHQPTPSGTTPIFWRGRTLSAGASLSTVDGAARWRVGADWSHSWADSLGGRNLFPGGGMLSLDATVDGAIGDPLDGRYGAIGVFYLRPYQNARADQPNRLIPQGQFWGAQGDISLSLGPLSLAPTVSVLRESSTTDVGTALVPSSFTATGWTISAGTAVDISLGRGVVLSPEIGATVGGVGTTTTTTLLTRRGRSLVVPQQVNDPVRGLSFGVTVRASW
jgi:hypothetical protein